MAPAMHSKNVHFWSRKCSRWYGGASDPKSSAFQDNSQMVGRRYEIEREKNGEKNGIVLSTGRLLDGLDKGFYKCMFLVQKVSMEDVEVLQIEKVNFSN